MLRKQIGCGQRRPNCEAGMESNPREGKGVSHVHTGRGKCSRKSECRLWVLEEQKGVRVTAEEMRSEKL